MWYANVYGTGSNRIWRVSSEQESRFGGVVVITSASHAEGREFEPRPNLDFYYSTPSFSMFSYRIENDIWSLGIITFTLLSGMAPFNGYSIVFCSSILFDGFFFFS